MGGERGHCSSSMEARQVPRVWSQPAVHLPHPDRSQQEVTCGIQIPRSRSHRLWARGSLVTSQIPLRTSFSYYVSANSLGEGQVPAWGPRTGVAEPEFKLIPALSSVLLSTYCVPGTWPLAAVRRTLTY